MTTSFNFDSVRVSTRWIQIGFLIVTVVFNLCLVTQLLTVGLAVFHSPEWWNIHVWFVRGFSGLGVLLLGWAYLSPFPRRVRLLTASLIILLGLQFLTIHLNRFLSLGILYPLIGFMLFTASTTLVHRVWHIVFDKSDTETLCDRTI
ncbi:DUF6220 domain-containing protein [Fischerella sp. PCC 9605]|uniref:DUF6220 domain-containing protein n=1 Tax=Fischerella sp. PCC 9605 TaxID=1173024 RepID=UPI0004B5A582|nr:DUF6220 domain-containing protein [Fischerella sp. PCC 9605]